MVGLSNAAAKEKNALLAVACLAGEAASGASRWEPKNSRLGLPTSTADLFPGFRLPQLQTAPADAASGYDESQRVRLFPQSLNLYAYAGNNPVSAVDPDGHVDGCWGSICSGSIDGMELIDPWTGGSSHSFMNGGGADKFIASNLDIQAMQQIGSAWQEGNDIIADISAALAQIERQRYTDFVSVSYWRTGASGFGHIGVAVDSDNTGGYSTLDPSVPWWERLFGAPAGRVENDILAHTSPDGEVAAHSYLHIPVTAAQAAAMQAMIAKRSTPGDGGRYNLLFNNCAEYVESVLHRGGVSGVPHAEIFVPAALGLLLWVGGGQ